MKKFLFVMVSIILFLFSCKGQCYDKCGNLNWDSMIRLDAEELAEVGIKDTYERYIVPSLRQYIINPIVIEEILNHDNSDYKVKTDKKVYLIYNDETPEYFA